MIISEKEIIKEVLDSMPVGYALFKYAKKEKVHIELNLLETNKLFQRLTYSNRGEKETDFGKLGKDFEVKLLGMTEDMVVHGIKEQEFDFYSSENDQLYTARIMFLKDNYLILYLLERCSVNISQTCKNILGSFEDILIEIDHDHRITDLQLNSQIIHLWKDDIINQKITQALSIEAAEDFLIKLDNALRTGKIEQIDIKTGSPLEDRWFATRIMSAKDYLGENRFLIALRDITSRKQVNEKLRSITERLEKFKLFSEHSRDIILFVRPDGKIIEWNQAAENTYGYTKEEMNSLYIYDLRNEDNEYVNSQMKKALKEGILFETVHKKKDGSVFPIEVSSRGVELENGPIILSIIRDITERKQMEENLAASNLIFKLLAENIDEAFGLINSENHVLYVNPAFEKIWGIDRNDLYADSDLFFNAIHPEDRGKIRHTFRREEFKEKGIMDEQYRIIRPDGTVRWIWTKSNPIDNGDASLKAVIASDITEIKKIEISLLKAKEMAEDANRAKSQFLANMSHEIRTPMNGIIGMIDLASEEETDEQRKEYLEIARNCATSMVGILNDLLDYARIDAGKLKIQNSNFSLYTLLNELKEMFRLPAAQKNLDLHLFIEKDVPEVINADSVRLRQILSNLLGNAIKFTKQGSVEIVVQQSRRQNKMVVLQFSIKDTGIGINQKELDRIYESFSQVDGSYTKEYGGTGLGLAISKELVEMMGGKIWAESRENQGSTFFFTLPAEIENSVVTENSATMESLTDRVQRGKILVAEDDEVSRILISNILKKVNYDVVVTFNGKAALDAYLQGEFKLILLDVSMPEMDGFQVAQEIKKIEKRTGKNTPIMAITAHALPEMKIKCYEAGICEYITKPIDMHEFLHKLAKWLPEEDVYRRNGIDKD